MAGEDYGPTGCLSCGAVIVQAVWVVVLVVWLAVELIARAIS